MLWVVVVVVLALAGVLTFVCYAVWLAHRTADLLSEVAVLGDQAGQLADLLGQIGAPGDARGRDAAGVSVVATRHTYDEP